MNARLVQSPKDATIVELHAFAVDLTSITIKGTWHDAVAAASQSPWFKTVTPKCCSTCGVSSNSESSAAVRMAFAALHIEDELRKSSPKTTRARS